MKQKDHTGQKFGAVTVLGKSDGGWEISWHCCHRDVTVTGEQLRTIRRNLPKRCVQCVAKGAVKESVRLREKREREKTHKSTALFANGHLWPELGKLGPR